MSMEMLNVRIHLDRLRDGRKLQDVVGLLLQLLLLLAGVTLVGVWWRAWSPGERVDLGVFGWIALVVWQVSWPVAAFCALQALFLRASEARRLPASRYVVAPVIEQLLRGWGEAFLAASLVLAFPAMLAAWFNGSGLLRHLAPNMPLLVTVLPWSGMARFWLGLLTLVTLPFQGLVGLLMSYFAAESLIALFAIADDVRTLREGPNKPADGPRAEPDA